MFDLLDEDDFNHTPHYNWLIVQIAIAGFATHVGSTFPGLTHHGVFVLDTNDTNQARCAEANRQMCVLCFALQTELTPENCDDYDVVITSLEEEIQHYREAMRHAAYRHLLSHTKRSPHEPT
jgi:hypothetical protein